LVILAISVRENKKKVKAYADKTGMTFPVLLDPKGQVAGMHGIRGTPAHFLIDNNGLFAAFSPGYINWDKKNPQRLIQHLINQKTN